MAEVRIRVRLDDRQTERLVYLKEIFEIENNAKLFKKLLEIKI
jgi:hypothetical protein